MNYHMATLKITASNWNWWKENKDIDLEYDQEEAYHKKEEEMLIRLIKIRKSLWT